MRTALTFFVILAAYGLLIVALALYQPLRLGEILQAGAFLHFSWESFFRWIAESPGGAPLHYLAQLPFALVSEDSRLMLRLVSIAAGLGSAFLFFLLAKRATLTHPLLAMTLFLVIPVHLAYATQGRPYEMGLFLLLLSSELFFSLLEAPGAGRSVLYGLSLIACLYTQPSCFLPAIGYAVCLLAFANVAQYRRALWYVLGALAVSAASLVRYIIWAGPQRKTWLVEQFPSYAVHLAGFQALLGLDTGGGYPWLALILMMILLLGLLGAIWSVMPLAAQPIGAPPLPPAVVKKRVILFCLAGGAAFSLLSQAAFAGWSGSVFAPYQALWSLPGLIVVFCGALDALDRIEVLKRMTLLNPAICIIAILLCIPGDIEYIQATPPDISKLAVLVRPQIGGDSCVVFVSQGLSRYIFELFDPELAKYECTNFFHKRVVLAIHPFVRPDQERDARVFFRGLDFEENYRVNESGGKVIRMDATQ